MVKTPAQLAIAAGLLSTLVTPALADLRSAPRHAKRAAPNLNIASLSDVDAATAAAKSYDYVIVGGGTAALAVARRIADARPSNSVLVIEAGSDGDQVADRILAPADAYYNGIAGPTSEYDWHFYTSNQTNLNARPVFWPRGKLVGGSSAVNGVYMTRMSKGEHDAWAKLNNASTWNFQGILPFYQKHETYETPTESYSQAAGGIVSQPAYHGFSGPIHYARAGYLFKQISSWIGAFAGLGIPNVDPAAGITTGAYVSTSAIRSSNSTRSYARDYFHQVPSNVDFLLGYQVTKINFATRGTNITATAVTFAADAEGEAYTVNANQEVILSAGVIGSPQLLQLSGVGPSDLLTSLGIPVVHDLPGVGAQLSDHLSSSITFGSTAAVTGDRLYTNSTFNQTQYELWASGQGNQSIYSAPNEAVAYLNVSTVFGTTAAQSFLSSLKANISSYAVSRGFTGSVAAGYNAISNAEQSDLLATGEAVAEFLMTNTGYNKGQSGATTIIQFALQHPFSRGWVNITSTDPFTMPSIDPGYLTHPGDIIVMREAFKFIRSTISTTSPLSTILTGEIAPGTSVSTDDQIDNYIRTSSSTEYHPAGSCAMMPLAQGGVVDSQARVYGISNLRVIDSSIIPLGVAAHLTSPTYALAEKAVALLLGQDQVSNVTGTASSQKSSLAIPSATGGVAGAAAATGESSVKSSATSLTLTAGSFVLLFAGSLLVLA